MNIEQMVKNAISSGKGRNIQLSWKRPCKTRKSCEDLIEKRTHTSGRLGIKYDNQKVVKEKRENGDLPSINQGLPWGTWEQFPYLIKHKDKRYLRVYRNTANIQPIVQYLRNGKPVSFEDISDQLLKSEKNSKSGDAINVNLDHMEYVQYSQ